MKPARFKLDRHVFELLKEGELQKFTIRKLRDAYTLRLKRSEEDHPEIWRYIYDQILRLKHVGWVGLDDVRRRRDQVFHVLGKPDSLELALVQKTFSFSRVKNPEISGQASVRSEKPIQDCSAERLEALAKEIRLDMLSSLGEAERYKQLFTEMPSLKARVEDDYIEARDRSSRLLGHLRAVENTLKMLEPT